MVYINQNHKNGDGALCVCPQCGEERRVKEWERRSRIESELDAYRDQYPEMFSQPGEFAVRPEQPGERLTLAKVLRIYGDVRDGI